jgi:pyruvate dehydrogenase E2 component (dihydrolipoamide acetyltransferase)
VLLDPDTLELRELSARRAALVERARAGAFSAEDIAQATFTITNLGMFGIEAAWPILNPPGVAILAVGRARQVAVVTDEQIRIGAELRLVLAADHRALDGAQAARFLTALATALAAEEGGA